MDPIPASVIVLIAILLFLLVLSAFFSSSETALTAASRATMHQNAKNGDKRAGIVNKLRQDSESLIGSILLGNNLVNILATALLTSALTELFGEAGVAYATIVMTITVLIFAEVLPKTYAINNPDALAVRVAQPIRVWLWISRPLTSLVKSLANGLLYLMGVRGGNDIGSHMSDEELRGAIDLHGKRMDREDVQHERAMLRSILDLDDVNLNKIMIHRKSVFTLDINMPTRELVEAVMDSRYTRIPLWENEPNNIIGIVHAKTLLRAIRNTNDIDELNIRELASEPWFVPDATNLLDQLQAFQKRREHFSIIVDEYGALMGIVTLEDILEEIVGEISDEMDAPVEGVRPLPDGSYVAQGIVTVRDLNREFDWNLPEDKAATIAGLIMLETRSIPEVSQVFSFYSFRFEILRRQKNQITQIKITPPPGRKEMII